MLPLAIALLLLVPAAAAAAPQLGAPTTVRVSRAADERAHPRARTEVWELQAVHPRTRRTVLVRLRHGEGLRTAVVTVPGEGGPRQVEPDLAFRGGDRHGARFEGPGVSASLGWHRRRVTLKLDGPQVSGRLTVTGAAGPLATGWRLGEAMRYPQQRAERVKVNYNVPVAAGRVSGSLKVEGRTLRLTGWRGSVEHIWGSFSYDDTENWAHWDAYTVHRGRTAWLAFGMNRRDTILGPGARDAQWLGVMARAGVGGTRVCRPRIDRRAWSPPSPITADPVPHRLDARCAGMRVVFKEGTAPSAWLRSDGSIAFLQQALRATTTAGGAGVARHDSRN